MKRWFFVVPVFGFLFFACDDKYYPVVVQNNSTKTISYTYNGISDSLGTSGSKMYEVLAGTPGPVDIKIDNDPSKPMSIKLERQMNGYYFKDVTPIKLDVENTLSVEITIKADNFIDGDNGGTELKISANDKKQDIDIYTTTPKFTIVSPPDSPAEISWSFSSGKISAIIR
jgi:hypothetical protein